MGPTSNAFVAVLVSFSLWARPGVLFAASADTPPRVPKSLDDPRMAQLLLVGFDGTAPNPDLKRLVSEWHVGGVVLYAQNIESPEQVARLNAAIHAMAGTAPQPFIAVDQEGGSV